MLEEAAGAVTESAAEAALQECSEDADALSAQGSLKSFVIFRLLHNTSPLPTLHFRFYYYNTFREQCDDL